MTHIRELTSKEDWVAAYSVLQELRNELVLSEFIESRDKLMREGYVLYGAYDGAALVAVAGIVFSPHPSRGLDIWVHDLATREMARSRGHGERLMRHLEEVGRGKGCSRLMVHTRLIRTRAQNFYEKHLNYEPYALVYQKDLG